MDPCRCHEGGMSTAVHERRSLHRGTYPEVSVSASTNRDCVTRQRRACVTLGCDRRSAAVPLPETRGDPARALASPYPAATALCVEAVFDEIAFTTSMGSGERPQWLFSRRPLRTRLLSESEREGRATLRRGSPSHSRSSPRPSRRRASEDR